MAQCRVVVVEVKYGDPLCEIIIRPAPAYAVSTRKSKIVWDRLLDFPLTAPNPWNCWTESGLELWITGPDGRVPANWNHRSRLVRYATRSTTPDKL